MSRWSQAPGGAPALPSLGDALPLRQLGALLSGSRPAEEGEAQRYKLKQRLAEIDENLVRAELTALERGECMAERKRIHEALHPEAKAGAVRAAGMNRALGRNVGETVSPTSDSPAKPFTTDTAEKLGVTERSVQQDVQVGNLPEPVREAIRETPIAEQLGTELAEIDENLVRSELTPLERGLNLRRRKEIYETLWPETRQGGKKQVLSKVAIIATNDGTPKRMTRRSRHLKTRTC